MIPAMLGRQKKALNVNEKHFVVLRGATLSANPRFELSCPNSRYSQSLDNKILLWHTMRRYQDFSSLQKGD